MVDFFVVGPQRSGGTLLYNILCSDPATNPGLKETHFVTFSVVTYLRCWQRLELEEGQFFADLASLQRFSASTISNFLDQVRERYAPARHLVIKSISLAPYCVFLHEMLPDVRFFVSVRDPRDIVASMIEVGEKQERAGLPNQYPRRNLRNMAAAVNRKYRPFMAANETDFRDTFLCVQYERLVADPANAVGHVEAWSGLDLAAFDPARDWPRTLRDFDAELRNGAAYVTPQFGRAVTRRRIGGYRRTLFAPEIALIEDTCAEVMTAFGYSRSGPASRAQ